MDALRMLEFPNNYFDLINQRFGLSYLRTWDWPNLLQEYQRVAKPGGTIRITECDISASNMPAYNTLCELSIEVMARAGHFSSPERNGITRMLESIMQQSGLLDLRPRVHMLEYHAGTPEGELFAEDVKHVFRTGLPFFRKWTKVPENYGQLYDQMVQEMQRPDFVATWRLLTVWGTNPQTGRKLVYDPH